MSVLLGALDAAEAAQDLDLLNDALAKLIHSGVELPHQRSAAIQVLTTRLESSREQCAGLVAEARLLSSSAAVSPAGVTAEQLASLQQAIADCPLDASQAADVDKVSYVKTIPKPIAAHVVSQR